MSGSVLKEISMRKLILRMLPVTVFAVVALGQASGIKGTVFDQNGAVVPGVEIINITKKKPAVVGTTDEEGKFSVRLSNGSYSIEIKHKYGHFCPIRLMDYRIVELMSLDIVFTDPRSSQDTGPCKTKTIKF